MNLEDYDKIKDLFGENVIESLFPELGMTKALTAISAIIQQICNILVAKGIITEEEYLNLFSDEELQKIVKQIEEQTNERSKGE